MTKNFFAGLEEVFSRLIGVVLTLLFFIIYITARPNGNILLDWYSLSGALLLFWFVYELISYLLFLIFLFFSRQKQKTMLNTSDSSAEENNL